MAIDTALLIYLVVSPSVKHQTIEDATIIFKSYIFRKGFTHALECNKYNIWRLSAGVVQLKAY